MITVTFRLDNKEAVNELIRMITSAGGSVVTYTDNTFVNQQELLSAIKQATGVTVSGMRSKDRRFEYVAARSIYVNFFVVNKATRMEIAKFLHRDHASVAHHIKEFNNRLRYDNRFRLLVAKVSLQLHLSERMLGMTADECRMEIHKLSSIYGTL